MHHNKLLLLGLALLVALGGCQSLSERRKIDYGSTRTLPPLEVPPDLSGPAAVEHPGQGAATYSDFVAGSAPRAADGGDASAVLPQYPGIRIARDGQTRWLVVKAEPQALWNRVREFVSANGLSIAAQNPQTGVIETEWAENRANVGTGGQRLLAKWLGTLYSTGTRDKYRLRLERGADAGTTEIYLSHQGMEEFVPEKTSDSGPSGSYWRPRATDPELEAEMLQRLRAHLGAATAVAATEPARQPAPAASAPVPADPAPAATNAALERNGHGAPVLSLQDSLDRAWRRVGLSLDRIGFTVEDRDRSKGVYYVRYIDPDLPGRNKGVLSRWFGSDDAKPTDQYQVRLMATNSGTEVEVRAKDGAPEASKTGERILSLLYEQLK